ncbi:MHYT domain signaling protein [Hirsutella rhossiliensis]|uniref:MHYT domain signaling protein n=1 Tax=Hirsutella rhossiliensis TaxID=111463 RepID=A0A9P8MWU8_9HYPO|nr:MHYT domain signaling protein [Hirsutella rhossiliensis]KAH0961691.1 MHYT domain signaling protein [Hirsutella rhossiliensis]
MRRRTSHRGLHNLLLLVGAAISMGGIAIWSMHFIGNRAIYILDGREDLQIAYSTGMTVLSLLVPIFVLLLAFLAVSVNGRIRWWRIGLAGLLSGGAICGMHYLADASISNYQTSYQIGYVVGAALIAVSATVSGMHWCAAVGTSYRLLQVHSVKEGMSRRETLIMVICLSVAACAVMTISGIYSGWIRRDYASKSQQVVLAAAVFDEEGRIMVNQEGFLPSEVVTDTFVSRSHNEVFDTTHPLFHWMYRASRNWTSVAALTDKMANHIGHLSQDRYNSRMRVKLVEEDGSLVRHYDHLICELFSLAALALAYKMKDVLVHAGTLWEEIFATGNNTNHASSSQLDSATPGRSPQLQRGFRDKSILEGLAEKGLAPMHQQYGRGCLMFLVRHISSRRDLDKLEAAGYRFAEVRHVVGSIRSSMQIMNPDFASSLNSMSSNRKRGATLIPGVHLGIFAIRARLDHCGFDVLVQKEAKNLLPTAALPLERLEPWQVEFITRLRGLTPSAIVGKLSSDGGLSPRQARFACHQLVYGDSPHHVEFSHLVHRELSSILHNIPSANFYKNPGRPSSRRAHAWIQKIRVDRGHSRGVSLQLSARSQEQLSTAAFSHSPPRNFSDRISFDECHKGHSASISSPAIRTSPTTQTVDATPQGQDKQLFGGIMVSQQIMVDVQEVSYVATAARLAS